MSEKECGYALITGASAGLGRAMAAEMAKRHYNLVLTALPDTGLKEAGALLESEYGIKAWCFEADMTEMTTPSRLKTFTDEKGIIISALINNVGIGCNGNIGSYSDGLIERMAILNMAAATSLTNTFVGDLKAAEKSYLLNIGSAAGFMPLPFKSIYSASKSYIYHFSMSLREELRGDGVSVSVAMPGPIKTNERVLESIRNQGAKANLTAFEPEEIAKIIINGMFKGRSVIIPGLTYSGIFYFSKIVPNGLLQMMMRNTFNKPG